MGSDCGRLRNDEVDGWIRVRVRAYGSIRMSQSVGWNRVSTLLFSFSQRETVAKESDTHLWVVLVALGHYRNFLLHIWQARIPVWDEVQQASVWMGLRAAGVVFCDISVRHGWFREQERVGDGGRLSFGAVRIRTGPVISWF